MSDPADQPSADGEQAWERLKAQIELSGRFWLDFVFSASPAAVRLLRERAEALLREHGVSLLLRAPERPADLQDVLPWLLSDPEPTRAGCTWIEVIRADPPGLPHPPWVAAWEQFFLRSNERRDALRSRVAGGLVLAVHPEIKPIVREAAPDLWSIRSVIIELGTATEEARFTRSLTAYRPDVLDPGTTPSPFQRTRTFTYGSLDPRFSMKEAVRRQAQSTGQPSATIPRPTGNKRAAPATGPRASQAHALLQAAEGFLAEGRVVKAWAVSRQAQALFQGEDLLGETRALWIMAATEQLKGNLDAAAEHVERAISVRRQIAPEELPIEWVDLAARLALVRGDLPRASAFYTEAESALRRRMKEKETVETLSDLRLVLIGLGDVRLHEGNLSAATDAFDEAVILARRLRDLHGDTLQTLGDLAVALDRLGNVRHDRGDIARASTALEEALRLHRQALGAADDSDASTEDQRALSIALTRVGRIRREMDDPSGAAAAFDEALQLRRSLLGALGETPQTLRDIASCLDQLGEIARAAGRSSDAVSAFEEALSLDHRRRELTGDTPETLRDLAISWYRLAEAQRDAGDPDRAAAAFSASAEIASGLRTGSEDEQATSLLEAAQRALTAMGRARTESKPGDEEG